jgi:hypothetical protein
LGFSRNQRNNVSLCFFYLAQNSFPLQFVEWILAWRTSFFFSFFMFLNILSPNYLPRQANIPYHMTHLTCVWKCQFNYTTLFPAVLASDWCLLPIAKVRVQWILLALGVLIAIIIYNRDHSTFFYPLSSCIRYNHVLLSNRTLHPTWTTYSCSFAITIREAQWWFAMSQHQRR